MNNEQLLSKLTPPEGVVDVILDTDAYNEIDDQFAIAYALLSPEKIRVTGICAAPFFNHRSESAADGMEKSYDEILKLLALMGRATFADKVYRGSTAYLSDEVIPVMSEAAEKLVAEARAHAPQSPLYIVALGALTNVASAILLDRDTMVNRTVIVWLGGHALDWEHTKEFNMKQDVAAARVVFGCGVPLVQLPCRGVVSELHTTEYELRHWLGGTNPLAEYLMQNTIDYCKNKGGAWSKVVWDISAVAWLMNGERVMMRQRILPSPIPQYDHHYSLDFHRHPIGYVFHVKRDAIFDDLFAKLRNEKK
ncbi:MAG: nucleoside hydrolase [Clostridia bacterium]|nr:nucleoside hydrolase [Clostridia bacterium]